MNQYRRRAIRDETTRSLCADAMVAVQLWPNMCRRTLVRMKELSDSAIVRGGAGLAHKERAAQTDKAQILVIEDEPSVADALRIILIDKGYEVAVASTGRAGLALASRRRFDVVVSDVRLPDVTGLEVLDAVRQDESGCIVILITSQCTTKLLADARARGAFAVLQKPFPPRDVLRLIAAALSKK
jgi:CheY-like chemotaxis protein